MIARALIVLVLVAAAAPAGCDDAAASADAGLAIPDVGPWDPGAPDPGPACDAEGYPWGEGGGLMLAGTDCLSCHRRDGDAATVLAVGGTLSRSATCPEPVTDAVVEVTDNRGDTRTLEPNAAGNFYTAEALQPPFRFAVRRGDVVTAMRSLAPHGGCAACHRADTALGLLHAP